MCCPPYCWPLCCRTLCCWFLYCCPSCSPAVAPFAAGPSTQAVTLLPLLLPSLLMPPLLLPFVPLPPLLLPPLLLIPLLLFELLPSLLSAASFATACARVTHGCMPLCKIENSWKQPYLKCHRGARAVSISIPMEIFISMRYREGNDSRSSFRRTRKSSEIDGNSPQRKRTRNRVKDDRNMVKDSRLKVYLRYKVCKGGARVDLRMNIIHKYE